MDSPRSRSPHRRWLWISVVCALAPGWAAGQLRLFPAEVERIDVIVLERDGRDVFAFDALTGGRARVRLEVGEEVHFEQAKGRIGLLLTDRRALAAAPGTGFQEMRFRLREKVPEIGLVEDQVALVVSSRRALGFSGTRGAWVEEDLSPNESVSALRLGTAAGVVVTNRRALGLGTNAGRFVPQSLRVKEDVESVSAQDTLVSLRTNRRILVFSAPRGTWTDQERQLR